MLRDNNRRSEPQELWDHVFLLNLFGCSEEPLDNLKVQKLVFITEEEARQKKLAAANFPFFRYDFGPFSKVAANDVRYLEEFGFIDHEYRRPTNRGQYVLEYVNEFIKHSPEALESLRILRALCQKYRDTKSSRLVDIVYGMKVSVVGMGGDIMTVRDIPKCVDILVPSQEELNTFIPFPDDLIGDLQTEFSLRPEQLDPNTPENIAFARAALARAMSS